MKNARPTQHLVASSDVAVASLHQKLPWQRHGYVIPFGVLYLGLFYVIIWHYETMLGSYEFAMLSVILMMALNALAILSTHWSVSARAFWTCQPQPDAYKADCIKIIPVAHQGSGAMCDIQRSSETLTADGKKIKFVFDEEKRQFVQLRFPYSDGRPMSYFRKSRGIMTGHDLKQRIDVYGMNRFDIPLPTFVELFKEHAVAPFFVFQLFCVALWFLDDMWYYSLFTLLMLFVFESTVVFQRLRNLQEFRSMSIKPYPVMVYRLGSWTQIQTDELLPGDICSILRSHDEAPVAADMLVLGGSCIANEAMLSGESTPQLKEPVSVRDQDDIFDVEADKNYMLFGGTKVLQVTPPLEESNMPKPPDHGAIAYVLRTGFSTQQGKLVRTIIYSTERVTANNWESLFFILFLLVFAVAAAAYVWIEGTKNEERKRSKVLLDCILIITSVVPPELPMELSLAVNNSLISLAKMYIFCTEPFRIPFAGKVDVCCFDKTGTLTTENLIVEGVCGLGNDLMALKKSAEIPRESEHVLAAAHALVMLEDGIIGDPMEKNTLEWVNWTLSKDETLVPAAVSGGPKAAIKILRRFPFSSALKRMSTVSTFSSGGVTRLFVAVKGAPETLRSMYTTVPAEYDRVFKSWAMRGSRVLALAYKFIDGKKPSDVGELHREDVESGLVFAGFLVFTCPLKPESAEAVRNLNNSSHRCVMITGDNALTACHVAKEVEIVEKPVLIADVRANGLSWQSIDEAIEFEVAKDSSKIDDRLDNYDLCVTGRGLSSLFNEPCFFSLLPRIRVYARVSPTQKEDILTALKSQRYNTLMCGDGTNDVGALKQAHVGIALLDGNKEDIDRLNKIMFAKRQQQLLEQQAAMREKFGLPPVTPPNNDNLTRIAESALSPQQLELRRKQQEMGKQVDALSQMLTEAEGEVPMIKFGDASVAAPFTSKLSTVLSVCNIVRQGRSTLVAMVQMYKILALNCLISAYSMSVMYLAGIKQGDWQATIGGLMITVCFFGIAKSTALETLSKKRPQAKVFNFYLILSVLGQAAIHVASLAYIRGQAIEYAEDLDEEINLDAEFKPNLLNSAVYLVSLIMQISTFAINYQGEPFRESLFKNKSLYNSLISVGAIAFAAASELSEGLNDWMQLVPFPGDFRYKLLGTMVFDFVGAWAVEQVTSALFSDNTPRKELQLK